ncbi:MAG: ribosome biogenesis GTPase Der [Anaerolineae bacterium]|nr:ribosome biogenesis GTPase Der [Anaerolineae bacterium]
MPRKPLVAIVGRPNVGKSTLFNRLAGERIAVIDSIPGTTRDRIQAESDWNGVVFNVVDTGGIEVYQPKGGRDVRPLAEGSIDFVPQIEGQALIAAEDADVILLVVDSEQGITAADEEIVRVLRRNAEHKPILVAANKADNPQRTDEAFEFYALGFERVFPISAYHNLGVGDLLDGIVDAFKEIDSLDLTDEEADDEHLKIAIVGRPNVGKSSLLNHLLGEDRTIVSPVAGTTRDAIDTQIQWHGMPVTLIDTAGIRRRGKIEPGVEKYSVLRTMQAIERADVTLLLVDGEDGVTEQDQHIAGYILEAKKSVVVVVNKWDLVEKDSNTMSAHLEDMKEKFNFLPSAPVIFISALTGQRIHQVLETAHRVWEARSFRIPTSEVNRILRDALQKHPPPPKGTRRLKIFFASQVAVDPPVFLFHVNDTRLVHFTYKRFLENQIREAYPFEGTPLILSFRPRDGMLDK